MLAYQVHVTLVHVYQMLIQMDIHVNLFILIIYVFLNGKFNLIFVQISGICQSDYTGLTVSILKFKTPLIK